MGTETYRPCGSQPEVRVNLVCLKKINKKKKNILSLNRLYCNVFVNVCMLFLWITGWFYLFGGKWPSQLLKARVDVFKLLVLSEQQWKVHFVFGLILRKTSNYAHLRGCIQTFFWHFLLKKTNISEPLTDYTTNYFSSKLSSNKPRPISFWLDRVQSVDTCCCDEHFEADLVLFCSVGFERVSLNLLWKWESEMKQQL